MSLLGNRIKELQTSALTVHAPVVIKYWFELADNVGEIGESLETFAAHFHPEDSDKAWESLCVLTDVYSPESLAELIGITVSFPSARHAEVKWSGK